MARFEFGGVLAAWVVTTADAGDGTQTVILPPAATTVPIYDAPDGVEVTDFLDETGAPVSAISVAGGDPYFPRFQGPDALATLWFQSSGGRWLPVPRWDDGTGTGGGGTGDVELAGGNSHEYPDSQSPPWLIVKRPNDNSDSSVWSNLLEIQYWDSTTSQYRNGFHVNEKGLLRTRGTTPADVPARFMAHPSQETAVPLVEVTLSDNTVKLLQVFLSQAVFQVPVVVPYVVNPLGERLYWGTADPNEDAAYASHRPNLGAAWINYNDPPGA